MNKITYTILTKDGDDFKAFGFGGFDLTEGKTLAQSLVEGASKEKARKLGFYAACVALVDLAKRAGYAISSKIARALSDDKLANAVSAYEVAADYYATEKRTLARLAKTSERLHAVRGFGGRVEEIDARLTAHAEAIRTQQSVVASAKANADKARAEMLKEEERVWSALRSDNDKKDNTDNTEADNTGNTEADNTGNK